MQYMMMTCIFAVMLQCQFNVRVCQDLFKEQLCVWKKMSNLYKQNCCPLSSKLPSRLVIPQNVLCQNMFSTTTDVNIFLNHKTVNASCSECSMQVLSV